MSMWTLEDGLAVVRSLQPLTRQFNYHLALGGGVLNNGASDKDLDLYFLPLGHIKMEKDEDKEAKIQENADKMLAFLESLWGQSQPIGNGGIGSPLTRILPSNDPRGWRLERSPDGRNLFVRDESPFSNDDYKDEHDKVIHRVKFLRPDDRIDVFIF